MKTENEITVMVNSDYHTLHNSLINNNFVIKEGIVLDDLYIINGKVNITQLNKLEVLKHCILIRSINEIIHILLYKCKVYDENGDILEQGKIECPVTNINQAINFMEAINYKKYLISMIIALYIIIKLS